MSCLQSILYPFSLIRVSDMKLVGKKMNEIARQRGCEQHLSALAAWAALGRMGQRNSRR